MKKPELEVRDCFINTDRVSRYYLLTSVTFIRAAPCHLSPQGRFRRVGDRPGVAGKEDDRNVEALGSRETICECMPYLFMPCALLNLNRFADILFLYGDLMMH